MFTGSDPQSYINSAEEKFTSNNFEDALKLANMAKKLNPNFNGIDKIIAAYQIHVEASKKNSNGLINWYAILGIVSFQAQTKTIKQSYNKLALMVHPDKNCSAAADGAFKLIKDAWEILSDPSARKSFDILWGSCSRPVYYNRSEEYWTSFNRPWNYTKSASKETYDSDPDPYYSYGVPQEYSDSDSESDCDSDSDSAFGPQSKRRSSKHCQECDLDRRIRSNARF